MFLTVASLSVRLIAGKASDRYGRRKVLMVSSTLGAISMLVLGLATTSRDVLIAITLYGFAQGMTSPTLFAWATDLSDEKHKGRGISSLYIFMEMGIGIGAFTSGFIYGNNSDNFLLTFLTASLMASVAFFYLVFTRITGRPRVETKTVTLTDVEQIP
jgi:MFS family permease